MVRVRYGARLITDSNPAKVSDGGTIYFNGIPLEYQPSQEIETHYGVEPWLSVERLWQNGTLTRFSASSRLFENKDLVSGHFQLAVGREFSGVPGLFIQAVVDTDIGYDTHYVMPSLETWKRFRLSDRAGFGSGAQIGYMDSENDGVSGGFYQPYIWGDWTVRPNAMLFVRASLQHLNSNNDYYTYYSPKPSAGLNFTKAGLTLTPELTVSQTSYTQFDPFWGLKPRT